MIATKERSSELTPAQYEVVNVLSCLHRKDDVVALKTLLVRFLNERLQSELDDMYEAGEVTDETFNRLGKQHLRTPYRTVSC